MKNRHPKGLYLLFATEMWERFSYYGMRSLLVLYLTKSVVEGGMGISQSDASLIYGYFTGFVYFTPMIGGWLADNYLGQRKAIVIGAILMMLGQWSLSYEASLTYLILGLCLLIIGNGFFKPNISVIVGDLYGPTDSRRDSAFTIFYMGINVGAFFAPLLTGYVALKYGYSYGFLTAGMGMLIGLIVYLLLGNRYLGEVGLYPSKAKSKSDMIDESPLTKEEKDRTLVILVIAIFCVCFFAGFEQAGSSMTLFTNTCVDRHIGSFEVPTEWFQSVNPLFIILLAPILSMLWTYLSHIGKEPSIPVKMALGMILLGVGFIFLCIANSQTIGEGSNEPVKVGMSFVIFAYLFHTIGELCLSPIGLSMVSKLSPVKFASIMMGVWFLSSFFANIIGGYIASLTSFLGAGTIFLGLAVFSILVGFCLLLLNKWLVKKSHGIL